MKSPTKTQHQRAAIEALVRKHNGTRRANPDVDKIVSQGQRYQRSLENYVEAVKSGRGLAAARREMKAARSQFEDALGPGIPLSVAAAAFGAGVGAMGFGPVGAVIGAIAGGAAPAVISAVPEKSRLEERVDEIEGPTILRAPRPPQFVQANRKANPNRYKKLMR